MLCRNSLIPKKAAPWYDLVVSLYLSIARLIISFKQVTPKQSGLITMPATHLEYPVTIYTV